MNRAQLTINGITIKYPVIKMRMFFSLAMLLLIMFHFALMIIFIPAGILVLEYGELLGVLATTFLMAGVITAVTYRGYRRALQVYLSNTEQITREAFPKLVEILDFVERECEERGMDSAQVHLHPTPSPNAFALGRRQNGHIVITDGLLAALDDMEELRAIVAHEIAHIDNRDVTLLAALEGIKILIFSTLVWVGTMLGLIKYDTVTPAAKRHEKRKSRKLMKILLSPIALFQKSISRHREYIADAEAANSTALENLKGALESIQNYSQDPLDHDVAPSLCVVGKTGGLLARLRSTHPPIEKRIQRAEKLSTVETSE